MDYESFLELVKSRRSIHKFKPDPIPDEYVDKIIEAARWAPSGANSQPWEFVIVKKKELQDKILEIFKEQHARMARMELIREPELRFNLRHTEPPSFINAPVYIIPYGDPRLKEAFPVDVRMTRGDAIFASSLANTFLYMILAAVALGLGAQWVSSITHPYPQTLIKELLGVPRELEMYDMMAVGYPDQKPKPRLVRSKEELIHHEKYDRSRFRTDKQIKDFVASLR